jgi:hypothetical protein
MSSKHILTDHRNRTKNKQRTRSNLRSTYKARSGSHIPNTLPSKENLNRARNAEKLEEGGTQVYLPPQRGRGRNNKRRKRHFHDAKMSNSLPQIERSNSPVFGEQLKKQQLRSMNGMFQAANMHSKHKRNMKASLYLMEKSKNSKLGHLISKSFQKTNRGVNDWQLSFMRKSAKHIDIGGSKRSIVSNNGQQSKSNQYRIGRKNP